MYSQIDINKQLQWGNNFQTAGDAYITVVKVTHVPLLHIYSIVFLIYRTDPKIYDN